MPGSTFCLPAQPCYYHKPFLKFLLCPAVHQRLNTSRPPKKKRNCVVVSKLSDCQNVSRTPHINQLYFPVFSCCVWFSGLWGCGDNAGSLCKWPSYLQRPVEDQQICLAKNPEDLLQEEQLLYQNPTRRGKRVTLKTERSFYDWNDH